MWIINKSNRKETCYENLIGHRIQFYDPSIYGVFPFMQKTVKVQLFTIPTCCQRDVYLRTCLYFLLFFAASSKHRIVAPLGGLSILR